MKANQAEFMALAKLLEEMVNDNEQMYCVNRIVDAHRGVEHSISPLLNNEVVTVGRYIDQKGCICDMCIFVGTYSQCQKAVNILRDRYFVLDPEDDKPCHYGTLEDCEWFAQNHNLPPNFISNTKYKERYG